MFRQYIGLIVGGLFLTGLMFHSVDTLELGESAQITGTVEPAESFPSIWVMDDADLVERGEATREGDFTLHVPAGEYNLYFEPTVEGYEVKYVTDVAVSPGENKDVGPIEISEGTPHLDNN